MESALNFDLKSDAALEILRKIQAHNDAIRMDGSTIPQIEQASVQITSANGQDFIGSGFRNNGKVVIHGSIGDFGFCSFGDGECRVEGNVGNFFGHSICSGIVIVRGHAKNSLGALGVGGLIAIYGNAADRVAIGAQGTDIVIRGSVASHAGLGMQNGTIIVGGSAGLHLGHSMVGGTIYIRGEAESISPDIEEHRMREPDRLKIGMLMLKSGIKSAGKEFRVYRSVHAEA